MTSDATIEPVSAPTKRFRLRFSLLALLVFITLVCLLLAWWVQPNRVVATALFHVRSGTPTITGDASSRASQQEFEILKKTQLALLKSHFVLNAAVRKPGIASLTVFQGQQDPADWLQRHLEVEFLDDSEILQISLRGTEAQASDLVQIVDEVAKAYSDEVLFKNRSQELEKRDLLARCLGDLNGEIKDEWAEYNELLRESGAASDSIATLRQLNLNRLERIEVELMRLENEQLQLETSGEPGNAKFFEQRIVQLRERQAALEKSLVPADDATVELQAKKDKLERLQQITNKLAGELQMSEIESSAPQRIEQLQRAVVSPAD